MARSKYFANPVTTATRNQLCPLHVSDIFGKVADSQGEMNILWIYLLNVSAVR